MSKHIRNCKYCGKIMPVKNKRKEFCDGTCRKNYWLLEKERKNQPPPPLTSEELQLAELKRQLTDKQQELARIEQDLPKLEAEIAVQVKKQTELVAGKDKCYKVLDELKKWNGKVISGAEYKKMVFNMPAGEQEIELAALTKNGDPSLKVKHLWEIEDEAKIKWGRTREKLQWEQILEECLHQIEASNRYFKEMEMQDKIVILAHPEMVAILLKNHPHFKTASSPPKPNRIDKMKTQAKQLQEEITSIQAKGKQLEESIEKRKNTKELKHLKDKDGFISAKDLKFADFKGRIVLPGELAQFYGPIERNRCAITLTGEQGSGKTYLSFDTASAFCQLNFTVAYFSCEEGITDITRQKIIYYKLDNEKNFKLKEEANLQDIHNAATRFDLIIIDSWGKLNADIKEFDKLRITYPNTIFIVIFQLTSGGKMRGGTMAAFDAAVNVEAYKDENEKRFAVCTKNRFNRTGIVYSVDERKVVGQ